MTSSKNTNDPRRDDTERNNSADDNIPAGGSSDNVYKDWSAFVEEHADDLNEVARSKSAQSFEKHAQRKAKKLEHSIRLNKIAELSILESSILESSILGFSAAKSSADKTDTNKTNKTNKFSLNNLSSRKSYIIPQRMQDPHVRFTNSGGPRDNTRSSWLDLDKTMEDYGDDFVPPNPQFENISWVTVVLWVLLIAGIAGILSLAFFPGLASTIGIASGIFALVGGLGLLFTRKKHSPYQEDYSDYGGGARV